MTYSIEESPTFPYPLRQMEYVDLPGALDLKEKIELSEQERSELLSFEEGLFDELKKIKEIKIKPHEVYDAALESGIGKAMVEIVYKKGDELKEWVKKEAKERGLDLEDKDILKAVYKAVFEDLFGGGGVKSGEEVRFENFEKIIKEKTGKDEIILKRFEFDDSRAKEGEIREVFANLKLKAIPSTWRERIHGFTTDWTKERVRDEFAACGGRVEEMANPTTLCRLTDPENNRERLDKLWEMKRKVKKMAFLLGENEDELSKGKVIVLDIYRKYINTQIADDMLLWVGAGENGDEIFSLDTSRVERLDKFIHGVSEEFDERGNRKLLSEKIDAVVAEIEMNRVEEPKSLAMISSDEQVRVANWVLAEYGFSGWKATKRGSELGKIGINLRDKIIYIPKGSRRPVESFLATLAHEIGGHVLSHMNWDAVMPLKIVRYYSAGGRDEVLAEAVGKKVEKDTRMMIDGFDDRPEINYYLGMKRRLEGGTFKDCLKVIFEAKVKKVGKSLAEVFDDSGEYQQIFDNVYSTTMRLFREHTPLNDTSGRLTTTDQLKYLEQESVVRALETHGLGKTLYVNGPDIYSLIDLIRLGAFDMQKIREPKTEIIEKIWLEIKDGLAKGKSVKAALDEFVIE